MTDNGTMVAVTPEDREALEVAAGAVLSAIYGADIDPFAEPEKWEFAEGVAKSVLAALSQSTAGEDET